MAAESEEVVVIIGGGVVGCATAYYLSQLAPQERKLKVILLERFELGGAASGKAAGLVADGAWAESAETFEITQKSFEFHQNLQKDLNLSSYRVLPVKKMGSGALPAIISGAQGVSAAGASVSLEGASEAARGSGTVLGERLPPWLDGPSAGSCEPLMGSAPTKTAQVHPHELCHALFATAAKSDKVYLQIGTAEGLQFEDTDEEVKITGVRLAGGQLIRCNSVVVAMGPWSVLAEDWFPSNVPISVPITGVRSTSVIFRHDPQSCGLLEEPFVCICAEDQEGCALDLFPRPDGDLWVSNAGASGKESLGKEEIRSLPPEAVREDPTQVMKLSSSLRGISSLAKETGPDVVQACIRPVLPDGRPIIGKVPKTKNAFLATGHGVWGISWGPLTGKAMAELLLYGKPNSLDLQPFAPERFERLDAMTPMQDGLLKTQQAGLPGVRAASTSSDTRSNSAGSSKL